MSNIELYGFVALGVVISVVLPLIRAFLPKPQVGFRQWAGLLWPQIRPYAATAMFSLIVAALLMAFLGDTISTWRAALLAGYSFDSTLQKLSTGNTSVE